MGKVVLSGKGLGSKSTTQQSALARPLLTGRRGTTKCLDIFGIRPSIYFMGESRLRSTKERQQAALSVKRLSESPYAAAGNDTAAAQRTIHSKIVKPEKPIKVHSESCALSNVTW